MKKLISGNGLSAGALVLLGPFAVLALWSISTFGQQASALLTMTLVGVLALGALAAAALLFQWGRTV
jgi:hypothetical protein